MFTSTNVQDVAYALTTSLEPGLLSDMDDFVDLYLRELFSRLSEMEKTSPLDREELRSHFDLVWLDYARVVVSGLWKGLSHEQIERRIWQNWHDFSRSCRY